MTTWTVFNTGTPAAPNETDGPIAVSTGFTINNGGSYWCTGIEFFAASTPPTGVVVTLYERSTDESVSGLGATLATKAAPGAITGGVRNQILFDTPVPVTAAGFPNGLYATLTTANRYVATGSYFTSGAGSADDVSGPITAYRDSTVGGLGRNGRFRVAGPPTNATNSYPQTTFNGGGYWVSPIITDVDPGGTTDVNVTDGGPRGARAGMSPANVLVDQVIADGGPRGAGAGGSPAVVTADHVVADAGSRGLRAGGSLAALIADHVVADTSVGTHFGGTPATVEAGTADITIVDRSGGLALGGSGATVTTSSASVADLSVWPVLVKVLACLEAAADEVEAPPLYRSIRMGDGLQANISPTEDECCSGLAWVRPVSIAPTSSFPTPENTYTNCPPGELAVEIELGMLRCAPFMAPGSTGDQLLIPTSSQHALTAYRVLADAAAMRRAACCLIEQGLAVLVGSWSPAPLEANCVGGTMRITVSVPFCERTC